MISVVIYCCYDKHQLKQNCSKSHLQINSTNSTKNISFVELILINKLRVDA